MANDNKKQSRQKPTKVNPIVATFAELKQVSWPSFGKTMKGLGAVLVVTGIFLIVLFGIDQLLAFVTGYSLVLARDDQNRQLLDAGNIAALIVGGILIVGAIACVIAYQIIKRKNNKRK